MTRAYDPIGFGLCMPMRRDKQRDFFAAGGEALVRAAVEQILGTACASDFTQGELPWRTEFGSLLHLLRHQKNDVALREMARVYVQDALRRWEPRIAVTCLDAERIEAPDGPRLVLRLRYRVVPQSAPGHAALFEDFELTVTV